MLSDLSQGALDLVTFQAPPTAYLVHLAMLAQAGGFLLRSQVHLRLIVLVGTGLYIAYYALHPTTPLWDAIFASSVIGLANVVGLAAVTMDRLPFAMGRARELYGAFDRISPGTIRPGRVRALARNAVVTTVEEPTALLQEGLRPGALHFLLEGEISLTKDGATHALSAPCFLGEIAFITGGTASADLAAAPGSRIVSWPSAMLLQQMRASSELDRAMRALISYDLARKLASSMPAGRQASAAVVPPAMQGVSVVPLPILQARGNRTT